MKNYKMLCLDIDGTLLNSEHKISEKTKMAISKLSKEKKIPVILVSARMPKGITFLQKELGIEEPIICYSGALILDKNNSIIANQYINLEYVKSILKGAKKHNMHISLYKDNQWNIEQLDKWAEIERDITGIQPELINFHNIFDVKDASCLGFNKVLIIGDENQTLELNKILKEQYEEVLNIYPSKPTYLEIMNKNVSKTEAIKKLLNIYDIDQCEVIAIGDNYNDMDMLKFAGLGVAMGNAPEAVKEISDYVTLSNDEDGVAYVINKYFAE